MIGSRHDRLVSAPGRPHAALHPRHSPQHHGLAGRPHGALHPHARRRDAHGPAVGARRRDRHRDRPGRPRRAAGRRRRAAVGRGAVSPRAQPRIRGGTRRRTTSTRPDAGPASPCPGSSGPCTSAPRPSTPCRASGPSSTRASTPPAGSSRTPRVARCASSTSTGATSGRSSSPTATTEVWGQAEFIAAEEMERFRGFWWAPDGQSLLVQRYDEAPVQTWHIADPEHPEREPVAQRYPGRRHAQRRGHALARRPRRQPHRRSQWDRTTYEYLGRVSWNRARRSGDPGPEPRPEVVADPLGRRRHRADQRAARADATRPGSSCRRHRGSRPAARSSRSRTPTAGVACSVDGTGRVRPTAGRSAAIVEVVRRLRRGHRLAGADRGAGRPLRLRRHRHRDHRRRGRARGRHRRAHHGHRAAPASTRSARLSSVHREDCRAGTRPGARRAGPARARRHAGARRASTSSRTAVLFPPRPRAAARAGCPC